MKFVLAPDSFKESMTAHEAALAMERGVKKIFPDAECMLVPMADGGEGTVQSLIDAMNGELVTTQVTDPLGRKIEASYGFIKEKQTAVIEVASASGIHLLKPEERNPLKTTSYGTGELIKEALEKGANRFIIGLGGSVTNDGGLGLLQALGARFLDVNGSELSYGGAALKELNRIDLSDFDKRLSSAHFEIASDVSNPLIGNEGASRIFGPQKGATEEMICQLDDALTHYADIVKTVTGRDVAQAKGAGAAGGLGAAFLAFFNSTMQRGVDIVLELNEFSKKVEGADYVFTGEGSIDGQTVFGKTPFGVSKAAQAHHIPVIGFAGKVNKEAAVLYEHGFLAIVCILLGITDIETALKDGAVNLENATETVCRIIKGQK
jgi:glycerate 2-kinase